MNWLSIELPDRCIIAIDGKTICGSVNKTHKAYHVVSAFVVERQITLGEIAVDEKSNEITAVPDLWDLLYIDNAIITADSMSCQRKIVEKIIGAGADYCIALKGNQPTLCKDVEDYFHEYAKEASTCKTTEKGHGRIELQEYYFSDDIDWLEQRNEWDGLQGNGMVRSKVIEGEDESEFTQYFITSLTDIDEFTYAVRKHWSIENQLHWCLDVIFREDAARARKEMSPLNMNVLRKTASFITESGKIWSSQQKEDDV